jgi:hypothetical protein
MRWSQRIGVVWLLVCSFFVGSVGGATCDPWNLQKYAQSYKGLTTCTGTDARDLSFSMLTEDVDLGSCIASRDKSSCDRILQSYASSGGSSGSLTDLQSMVSLLIQQPSDVCICVDSYQPQLDSCVPLIDSMQQYCEAFYPTRADDASGKNGDTATSCSADAMAYCFPTSSSSFNISTAVSSIKFVNDTVRCLARNYQSFKFQCMQQISELLVAAMVGCSQDIVLYCTEYMFDMSITGAMSIGVCLAEHYNSLSDTCKHQLFGVMDTVMPCFNESKAFCPLSLAINGTHLQALDCLLQYESKVGSACLDVLSLYKLCDGVAIRNRSSVHSLALPQRSVVYSAALPGPRRFFCPVPSSNSSRVANITSTDSEVLTDTVSTRGRVVRIVIIIVLLMLLHVWILWVKNGRSFEGLTASKASDLTKECFNDAYNVVFPPQFRDDSIQARVPGHGRNRRPAVLPYGGGVSTARPRDFATSTSLDVSERGGSMDQSESGSGDGIEMGSYKPLQQSEEE